jgi:hypothetical protein
MNQVPCAIGSWCVQLTLMMGTLATNMIPLCEIVRLCVDVGLREASEFYFQ